MRESSSESDDVELESNYSSSENDDDIKGCYMNEPEYLEKEINAMNILENENFSENSEESDLDSVGSKIFTGAPVLNVGLL